MGFLLTQFRTSFNLVPVVFDENEPTGTLSSQQQYFPGTCMIYVILYV